MQQKVSELQDNLNSFKEISENAESENKQLKQRLREAHIKEEIRKWKLLAKWLMPLFVVLLIILFFQLFFRVWEYNIVTNIVT